MPRSKRLTQGAKVKSLGVGPSKQNPLSCLASDVLSKRVDKDLLRFASSMQDESRDEVAEDLAYHANKFKLPTLASPQMSSIVPLTPPRSSDVERLSDAGADDENQSDFDLLLASLAQIAGLRFKTLENRVSISEESRHIRNLNAQLLRVSYMIHNLASTIRETDNKSDHELKGQSEEWENSMRELEDCIEQSEEAGRRFELKQDTINRDEEQLQAQEEAVYNSCVSNQGLSTLVRNDVELENTTVESELDINIEIQKFITLSKTTPKESVVSPDDFAEHLAMSDEESGGSELILLFGNEDPEDCEVRKDESLQENFFQRFGPTGTDHSQFLNEGIADWIEKAREASLVLDSGFCEDDLDLFLKWLARGHPFSHRLEASPDEPPLPNALISLFRVCIWQGLHLFSKDRQSPSTFLDNATNHDLDYTKMKALLVQDWLWDPHADMAIGDRSAGQEACHNDIDASVDVNEVVNHWSKSSRGFDSTPAHPSEVGQSCYSTLITDRGHSRRSTGPSSVPEQENSISPKPSRNDASWQPSQKRRASH